MKSDQLSFRPGFRLSVSNSRSQAAVLVLAVGGREGGPATIIEVRINGYSSSKAREQPSSMATRRALSQERWCSLKRATITKSATPDARS